MGLLGWGSRKVSLKDFPGEAVVKNLPAEGCFKMEEE